MTERIQSELDVQGTIQLEDLSDLCYEELVRRLGNVANTKGCEAVPYLERLASSHDHSVAKAACNALSMVDHVSAADALSRIVESAKDKDVRKQAGHSLHKLRSRGIEPEEILQPAQNREIPGFIPSGKMEKVYATYYDPIGTRLLIMGLRPPGKALHRVIWAISEEKGIQDSSVSRLSKRGLEEWISQFTEEKEGIFEIDPIHGRYVANEAHKRTSEVGASLPEGIGIYLDTVRNMPDSPHKSIIYELLDERTVKSDSTAVLMSESLLDLRECQWRLDAETGKEYSERVLEVMNSVIITSGAVREERLRKIVDEFIADEFSQDIIDAYRRRLEETAYLFILDDKMEYARCAFGVALRMASNDDIGTIPFIRGLVGRSIGIVPPDSREGQELARRMAEKERVQLVKPVSQDRLFGETFREMRNS